MEGTLENRKNSAIILFLSERYNISENERFVSIIEELKTITINFASTNKY